MVVPEISEAPKLIDWDNGMETSTRATRHITLPENSDVGVYAAENGIFAQSEAGAEDIGRKGVKSIKLH